MKHLMYGMIIYLCFFWCSYGFAQKYSPKYLPAKIRVIVKDDEGHPIEGILVNGGFSDFNKRGARDCFKKVTDENGMLVVTGKAIIDFGMRIEQEGYYWREVVLPLSSKEREENDRWEKEIAVKIKRIRNPIPMYVKEVVNPAMVAHVGIRENFRYILGNTARYDFVKGDFLPPHGKGEVEDIKFIRRMDILSKDEWGLANDYDEFIDIYMTNCVDGVCRGIPDMDKEKKNGSDFISDYEAPVSGYTNHLHFYRKIRHKGPDVIKDTNDDDHYLWYFRIRTQVDGGGDITNALYGKVYDDIGSGVFTYYLNPTPNDRNIEFARGKNLFKEIKSRFMP